MLSFVRAFASAFSARFSALSASAAAGRELAANVDSMSRCAYQTSRFFIAAKRAIAVRYSSTVSSTTRSCAFAEKPLSWAAMSMLTASRLTSHSHGPGSVSSKSLMSNTSLRSGEANTPKFDRCASPQHWTVQTRARRRREVAGHDQRAAAVEGEGGDEHPPVADRHELGNPRRRLALEQLHRVRPVRRRLERRVARTRHLLARRLAARDALGHRQVRHGLAAGRRRAFVAVAMLRPYSRRGGRVGA